MDHAIITKLITYPESTRAFEVAVIFRFIFNQIDMFQCEKRSNFFDANATNSGIT